MSSHSPVSVKTYFMVYVSLLLLTLLTVTISQARTSARGRYPWALSIAAVKTALVGVFFMHLAHAGKLTWLILAAGLLFLSIMLVLTFADYATRGLMP